MVEDPSHLWFKIRFDRWPGEPVRATKETAPASPLVALARCFLTIAKCLSLSGRDGARPLKMIRGTTGLFYRAISR